jgi:hypothetical protein
LNTAAHADCTGPQFETHCVAAKVVRALTPEPDIKQRPNMDADPNSDWTCRREISLKGYKGSAYIQSRAAGCPEPGKEIFGDLQIPCNDAGQRTPVIFVQKSKNACNRK